MRHINFNGVTKINDEVLRREMRQLEGGWLSNVALDRSKQRLERLPYIKKVESETKPVAGSADLVDVNYKIEEGPSAQLGGGIGYSESQSFILSGNYADANFLGTGRRVSVDLNSGQFSKVYGTLGHRAVFHGRQRRLHQQPELSRPDAVRFVGVRLLVGDAGGGVRRGLSDFREPGCPLRTVIPEVEPAGHQRQQRAPVHRMGGAERQSARTSASTSPAQPIDCDRPCLPVASAAPTTARWN